MHIRPVAVEDVAWLPRLAERLFAPWEDDYGRAVASWMGNETTSGWVAVEGPRPLGFVLVGTLGLIGEGRPHIVEILAVGAAPEAQRRGVARALVSRVLREARSGRAMEVRLNVAADNEAGRALFAQAGFHVDREDDGAFGKGPRALRMTWRP